MAIQKQFTINHATAYVGQIADGQLANTVSRVNGDSIKPFGAPVLDGDVFVGLTVREVVNQPHMQGTEYGYPANRTMTVLNAGVMWIEAPATVVAGGKVYLVDGKLAETGTEDQEIQGAAWLGSADKGELVKIKLVIGA